MAFVDGYLGGRLYAVTRGGILVSDDGGGTWMEYPVEGVAVHAGSHPADPARAYAWVYAGQGGPGRLWRLDESGPREVGSNPASHISLSPVPDPWVPGGFYMSDGDSLYHTSDEGTTWRAMDLAAARYITGLAPSDSEPGLIYAHTRRHLFRSHDGGETWRRTEARLGGLDPVESVSAFGPSGLLINTPGGAYVSTDQGETAVPVTVEESRLPMGTLWFDDLDRLNMATMVSRDDERYLGIFRRDRGAWQWLQSWSWFPFLAGPFEVVFRDPRAGEVLIANYAGTTGYLRSATGGDTWDPLESSGAIGYLGSTRSFPRPSIFADPERSGVIYLGDEGLWMSWDYGESWERIGPFALRQDPPVGLRPGGAVLASRDSLAVLYGDSLWVGHKDGWDWRVASRLEPRGTGLDLARHPDEPGLLYAAATTGCFVSTDGGRSWRRTLEPGSRSWRSARLRGHPHDADALYLAADRELYHSPDRGSTWRAIGAGHPGVPWINDVAVDPLDPSTLYVATSAGLFSLESRPTSVAVEAALPRTTELLSSYPNPFNASTVIPFRLGAGADVRIDIFNLLGQRVRRLLDERRAPGLHKVSWNGTDDRGSPVSSGVYFYRLTTGEVAETRRCMLIR